MVGEHEEGAVSRRRFLKQSVMAAAALGAGAFLGPGEPHAVDAAGPASPLQPPPDELLVTIQQINSGGAFHVKALTGALNTILQPMGWMVRALRVIVFQGQIPGGGKTTFTVIRYYNVQAPGQSVFLAAGTILAHRAQVQAHLPGGTTLVSVTPNWAIAAAPSNFIEGGPGGLPAADAACGAGWHFDFPTLPPAGAFLKAPAGATVAVLDTSPLPSSLSNAASRFPGNMLLGEVVTQLTAPGQWYNALAPSPVLPKAQQQACGAAAPYAPYLMTDHGLFVAGIVRDIAPSCTLTMVRVLNDWGAGYLSNLLAGLAGVPVKGPLVVSMSLTVRMPSIAELHTELGSSPFPVVVELLQEWPALQDACAPLGIFLQQLAASQVFLVAATGNDSGSGPLVDPCAPAAFDTTMGVAAVNQLYQRACYSNKGDDEAAEGDTVANGIATFGGDSGGAVHGLYSAPHIHLPPRNSGPLNQRGWAQWMGTSFATPVIAALAANYKANNPAASPDLVMHALRAAATPTDPTLQAPTIQARQVC
jgi:hypothetical protein